MNRRGFLKGLFTATATVIAGKTVVVEKIAPPAPVAEDTYTKAQLAMNKLIAGLVRRRMEDVDRGVTLTWYPGHKYMATVRECVIAGPGLGTLRAPDLAQLKDMIAEKAKMMQATFERAERVRWSHRPYLIPHEEWPDLDCEEDDIEEWPDA